jgi:hypothetical protein
MSDFTPEWRLLVNGVNYSNVAIADISHQSGREDIYIQPNPSYMEIALVALEEENYVFDINDSLTLQVKDSTDTYVTLFGGNITDITTSVSSTGSIGKVYSYNLIAMGSLARLAKTISEGVLTSEFDGDQIYALLTEFLLGDWVGVSAAQTWADYDPSITWATAENLGIGDIDQPGQYEMVNRGSATDTIYNIASQIANSAFGYLYEDNAGNIGYADADNRQNYLAANGAIEVSANTAIGAGLTTTTTAGNIRNDIALNYGNNFNDLEVALDATSISIYGYKSETINSSIKKQEDAENIVNRYLDLRAYPYPVFDSITFPITNPELDDVDRDHLLGVFMGQPLTITDLPPQIASEGRFQGYVEGWSWSTSFNQLYLTINLSPIEFSAIFQQWNEVNASEAWNTLSGTITWQTAIGVIS